MPTERSRPAVRIGSVCAIADQCEQRALIGRRIDDFGAESGRMFRYEQSEHSHENRGREKDSAVGGDEKVQVALSPVFRVQDWRCFGARVAHFVGHRPHFRDRCAVHCNRRQVERARDEVALGDCGTLENPDHGAVIKHQDSVATADSSS